MRYVPLAFYAFLAVLAAAASLAVFGAGCYATLDLASRGAPPAVLAFLAIGIGGAMLLSFACHAAYSAARYEYLALRARYAPTAGARFRARRALHRFY